MEEFTMQCGIKYTLHSIMSFCFIRQLVNADIGFSA